MSTDKIPRDVMGLAQHYKMDAVALNTMLEAARDEYQRNTQRTADIPGYTDVRTALEPIADHAKGLLENLRKLDRMIYRSLDNLDGEDSPLGDLELGLLYLVKDAEFIPDVDEDGKEFHHVNFMDGGKINEVLNGWVKGKKYKDTARNMAMMRIAQAWKRLTNKPATYATARNKISSDNPDNPAPEYYNGNRYGDFLDFFTKACEITGIENNSDAAVGNLVRLKNRNPGQF